MQNLLFILLSVGVAHPYTYYINHVDVIKSLLGLLFLPEQQGVTYLIKYFSVAVFLVGVVVV